MSTTALSARAPALIAAATVLAGLAGRSRSGESTASAAASAVSAAQVRTASPLGDPSPFSAIADDVSALVGPGDLPGAGKHANDLEVAWDSADAGLRPRAAGDGHTLDRAIGGVLQALRADPPNQADCKAALFNPMHTFATLQGQRKAAATRCPRSTAAMPAPPARRGRRRAAATP